MCLNFTKTDENPFDALLGNTLDPGKLSELPQVFFQ